MHILYIDKHYLLRYKKVKYSQEYCINKTSLVSLKLRVLSIRTTYMQFPNIFKSNTVRDFNSHDDDHTQSIDHPIFKNYGD